MKKIISTSNAPAAIGPYSQAVEVNGTLYVSGQIPVNPATGKIVEGDVKAQAEQVFANINAILTAAGYAFGDVVKSTVFITDMSLFPDLNEVYKKYYTGDFPARSTIAVKGLPLGALVEIETIAVK
jgi:2-iminobutanoate/2-iminopropanoate deaminase